MPRTNSFNLFILWLYLRLCLRYAMGVKMEIKQKIRNFLGKFINAGVVTDEDNIFERGLVNSLFAMQLVNFVEKEFDVSVNNEELDIENFKNINAIANLVESKLYR